MTDRLTPEYEDAIEADRKFFRRHPRRQFRLRLASRAEADVNADLGRPASSPGLALLILVRSIAPGVRARLHFTATADLARDTDQPEEVCRALWNEASGRAPARIGRVEAALRTIAGEWP